MKQIDISTKRYPDTFALVDDRHYERLNQHKWFPAKEGHTLYAKRNDYSTTPSKIIRMHREITMPPKNEDVDHRDRNGLNNQEYNLRNCTRSQNSQNSRIYSSNKSGYRGVSWSIQRMKWKVHITLNGYQKCLGCFTCLIRAAKTYDKKARELFGEFANTNFKKGI